MISLRRQLLVTVIAVSAIATTLSGTLAFIRARDEANALFDYQLQQLALALSDRPLGGNLPRLGGVAGFDFVIQVWDRFGIRRYYSHPHRVLPDRAQLGFATVPTSEGNWRVFSLARPDQVIQVAQPVRVRQRLALAAALRTVAPLLWVLPLLLLASWWVIGRGLKPLARLATEVGERNPEALTPIPLSHTPEEARPLVGALNSLLDRLATALDRQRAFTADAAHELRTPLTALKLQLQWLERADSDAERRAALAELAAGHARVMHVLEQLLTLARSEGAPIAHHPVDLVRLAGDVLATHAPLAESRGIDLGLDAPASMTTVVGDPAALRSLVGNLVANALRHAPDGGQVDVRLAENGGQVTLEVADTGPGIAEAERERVFDRFYRAADAGEGGSGLGLAIVQAVATRHGAVIDLGQADLGGLSVRVRFPPYPTPALVQGD
ncbi:ATP-binding protein [Chitiniphilus eburneus]|uniref:histidine kinase n=1 Tax=Chitiniphilus eburneus TaxID=2571148 RepID=A0A4U0QC41_9NEIS|nr:ATP-binding protein [Chitiniphilus eburneus]TJZ78856.1 HAMP domain-containing protein [Chitiniphilus eburneus]